MGEETRPYKIPESVLVVIHTQALEVLLMERTDAPGYWQSVTGSKDSPQETPEQTCVREVMEETGIDIRHGGFTLRDWRLQNVYEIYPRWRARYAPGVTNNTEHVFSLLVPSGTPVRLNPSEHVAYQWLAHLAAADRCFSPSNAEACLLLPKLAV